LVAAGTIAACGGSDTETPPVDAGMDVQADHFVAPPVDAGVDSPPPPVDAGCMPVDADLNAIGFPDATINEAGATTNDCVACAHQYCQTYLDQCNGDCVCKNLIVGVLDCITADGGLNCASGLIGNPDQTAISFGECVYAGCMKRCGLPAIPEGGVDAPPADAPAADSAPVDAAGGG
jgi:hypothetical protein